MASIKTKFAVGLFVIIGFVLAIAGIIWLGLSHYFEKGTLYSAYFDQSVQGLDKDSPVKYRGLTIGRVDRIGVAPDDTLIEVIIKIESDIEMESDMVARLKAVGITGIMFVEIERKKTDEPDLSPELNFKTEFHVIATRPSEIEKIFDDINLFMETLKDIDLKGISDSLKSAIDNLDHAVDDAQVLAVSNSIQQTFNNMNALSTEARVTAGRIGRVIENSETNFITAIESFNQSMAKAEEMMDTGKNLIINTDNKIDRLTNQLSMTINNLERATDNLNSLIEYTSEQPSQLLFGEPPPRKQIENLE
ncbi:MAG: MlaD family protein [Desulfobacterales bacterium]|nr:MlaD family protein [Desulfobacterales bacterium]